jgi:hypothetical protein
MHRFVARDREDDIANALSDGASKELKPQSLAQLNERGRAECEQRLNRVENEMVVKHSIPAQAG